MAAVTDPDVDVVDDPARSRFEARVGGELAGIAEYERRRGRIIFTHAEVDPAFGHHGVATHLIRDALDAARAEGLTVVARCPFVAAFIRDHPAYADLLHRGR